MRRLLSWLHLVALIVWLGETVFLSFVVAPSVFRAFPVEQAGSVMSALFPGYYAVGSVCGVILVASAFGLWRTSKGGRWAAAGGVAALMLGAVVYAGVVVQPRVHELRAERHRPGAGAAVDAEFDRLHRMSVRLNGLVLVGGLMLSVVFVAGARDRG